MGFAGARERIAEMTFRAAIARDSGARREDRLRRALYRGAGLGPENPVYLRALCGIADELLRQDGEPQDLTVEALGIGGRRCTMEIRAKEAGIAAGVSEAEWIYRRAGQPAAPGVKDGEAVDAGDILLAVRGDARTLLSLERLVVNLLQRMSGVATATRRLVDGISRSAPQAHLVGTRKTPWGLLDKRAISLGGGGTHRLSLGDAILIKTNHLRLAAGDSAHGLAEAIARAWKNRQSAAFFEVEVTSQEEALAGARILGDLAGAEGSCPSILMLDNFSPEAARRAVEALRNEGLLEAVLLEVSGKVNEASLAAYAAAGVDAISVGALTHSSGVLDLSAKLIPDRGERL